MLRASDQALPQLVVLYLLAWYWHGRDTQVVASYADASGVYTYSPAHWLFASDLSARSFYLGLAEADICLGLSPPYVTPVTNRARW